MSSPFLPKILRNSEAPLTDNSRRAHESAAGTTNIRDELSVEVELDTVRALVAEWIPFGANQIVALNERLGAMDRCQGGLFTAMVDKSPNDTKFQVPVGLTQVKILDFDIVRHINFEAEIMYPEEEGIVQVENFGMHLSVDGTVLYGIKVRSVCCGLRATTAVAASCRVQRSHTCVCVAGGSYLGHASALHLCRPPVSVVSGRPPRQQPDHE